MVYRGLEAIREVTSSVAGQHPDHLVANRQVSKDPPRGLTRLTLFEERRQRLHPGITQEVAPNESQRGPKPTSREALIYEAFFVARWLQSRFEKGLYDPHSGGCASPKPQPTRSWPSDIHAPGPRGGFGTGQSDVLSAGHVGPSGLAMGDRERAGDTDTGHPVWGHRGPRRLDYAAWRT